jgi:hypothetical protein
MDVKYIINTSGDINLSIDGENWCISPGHPNYSLIKTSLKSGKYGGLRSYCNINELVLKISNGWIEAKYNAFYDKLGREKSWDYITDLTKRFGKLIETKQLRRFTLWELLNK